jgi:RNA polymerase sigma factor (sigma-70 family)
MERSHQNVIIENLKNGDEKTIDHIYTKHKNEFYFFLRKYDLAPDDLSDIYQDSIMALCDNAKKGTIDHLESSLSTYLFSIGKYMTYKRLKIKNKNQSIGYGEQLTEVIEDEDHNLLDEEEVKFVQEKLSKLSCQCQNVLRLFYYEEKNLDTIQLELKYTNKDVLKSQKSRCLKQLKNLLKK